jgi:hypothetical protein
LEKQLLANLVRSNAALEQLRAHRTDHSLVSTKKIQDFWADWNLFDQVGHSAGLLIGPAKRPGNMYPFLRPAAQYSIIRMADSNKIG